MKKHLLIISTIFFLAGTMQVNAQFTKGGTYKNYEKYHVSYDTIKTVRTVSTPAGNMEKVGYFFINVGPAIPVSRSFTNQANISTPTSTDFAGAGGLGGSTGVDVGLGAMYGIPGINKHLIPQLDLGIYQSLNFTYLPWSYNSLGSPFSGWDYTGFMAVSTCIAPALIVNPLPGKDLHIDVIYKFGLGATFGGGISNSGTSLVERDEIGFSFYHGPTINFRYSLLLVGMEFAFIGDYGTMYFTGSGSSYMTCSIPLNTFAVKLGVKL